MNGEENARASELYKPRTMHLFAGAGGGILADVLLGHQCVCAVEIEPYCQQVLSARQKDGSLPWFPIFDDVTKFDGKPWSGIIDIVAGGFPCQDISVAGKGEGLSGERSGLWSEQLRIIREVGPGYAYVENSPALTSRGLGVVLGDLAEIGFDAEWGVLSGREVGAVHFRERIWILATNNSKERRQRLGQKEIRQFSPFPWGKDVRGVADVRGRPDLPQSLLCRSSDGMANGVDRLAAIGNGQIPRVAAVAYHLLGG